MSRQRGKSIYQQSGLSSNMVHVQVFNPKPVCNQTETRHRALELVAPEGLGRSIQVTLGKGIQAFRTLSAGSVSLPLGTILKTYCKQNRRFSVAIIIIAIMVTPFLVNYLNGARVLTQQVLSRHNSLEGTEIILFVCLFVSVSLSSNYQRDIYSPLSYVTNRINRLSKLSQSLIL